MAQINEWLSITQTEGRGDATITLTASSSKELQERVQSLQITTQTKTNYLNIKQKAFAPSIILSNTELTFTDTLLQNTTTVISNVAWTAVPSAGWINISQLSGESGTTTLIINVPSINSPILNRTGYIDFYWGDELMKTVEIKQEFEVVFELSSAQIDITNGAKTITINSNIEWTANYNDNWYTLSQISGGIGKTSITITPIGDTEDYLNGAIMFYYNGTIIKVLSVVQGNIFENCFYIEPDEINNKNGEVFVGISLKVGTTIPSQYNDCYFEYYEGGGWKKYFFNSDLYDLKNINSYSLKITSRLYIRNFNRHFIKDGSRYLGVGFYIDGYAKIGGNITTLIGEMNSVCGYSLFSGFNAPASLTQGNKYTSAITDASNLILPFETAPYCYANMFLYQEALTSPPQLPAVILTSNCYRSMFSGCNSLNYIKCYAEDISAEECLTYWLSDVSPTGTFVKKANIDYPPGENGIPSGWTIQEF